MFFVCFVISNYKVGLQLKLITCSERTFHVKLFFCAFENTDLLLVVGRYPIYNNMENYTKDKQRIKFVNYFGVLVIPGYIWRCLQLNKI